MKYSNTTPLPNDYLAEQAILNILLETPSFLNDIVLTLKPESFYFEPHKIIYESLLKLREENNSLNLTSLISFLTNQNLLIKIGGLERIVIILNRFENYTDLYDYVKLVNEKYLRRLLIQIGKQTIISGYNTTENIEIILEKLERSIFFLNQQKPEKIYTVAEIIDDVFSEMKAKIKKTTTTGLLSSFNDLDSIIQGFEKSDLIIIAGRPSMGKTAFSLNLAKNIVEKYECPLLIFSLEMSRQQIIYRFLATDSNISANRLKSGKMSSLEWKNLGKSMKNFSTLPIFIDDNVNLTLVDIRSKLRKIFPTKGKKGLVIIDYLQLMKLNLKLENRVQEISYITRNLKLLSKEFEVPIIVLSQLSRNVESRTNKRPMLSDLRESGCMATILKKNNLNNYLNYSQFLQSWNKNEIIFQQKRSFEFKGIKPTFLISFENGVTISLTSNHKILSKKGWIKIRQLQVESEIYCIIQKKENQKEAKFQYHKVQQIYYDGINEVYDKTIPVFHNYIEQNFILHNSIEQDADIVIMLYREEYYTNNTSQSQLTEFIVSKNRNGATGTAKLVFKPFIASFSNI